MTDDTNLILAMRGLLYQQAEKFARSELYIGNGNQKTTGLSVGKVWLEWNECLEYNGFLPLIVMRANYRFKQFTGEEQLVKARIIKDNAGLCYLRIKKHEKSLESADDIPF